MLEADYLRERVLIEPFNKVTQHGLITGKPDAICGVGNVGFLVVALFHFEGFWRSFIRSIKKLHHLCPTKGRKDLCFPKQVILPG
jgi:hypothetical protein